MKILILKYYYNCYLIIMISPNDSFEDINTIDLKTKYEEEINNVYDNLCKLNKIEYDYEIHLDKIYNDILISFSESNDCNILFNFNNISSKAHFYKIMYNTPYYKQLQISLKNYNKRYKELLIKIKSCRNK